MLKLKRKIFVFTLLATFIFNYGCATPQRAKKIEELEGEISRITQSLNEKNAEINRLQELLNNQHKWFQEKEISHRRELEKLHKEVNALQTRLKSLEKRQPALK